jgi:dolichol kinase
MELRHEAARKSIHLALLILPVLAWFTAASEPRLTGLALGALALLVFAFDLIRRRPGRVREWTTASVGSLLRPHESDRLLGSTLYFAALALSFLLFPRTIALSAMAFLVIGDSAAALAGRAFGRRPLRPGKTLEGTLACLAGCLLVTLLVHQIDSRLGAPVLILGAAAATLGELAASGERDNLVMPLVSGAVMLLAARSC